MLKSRRFWLVTTWTVIFGAGTGWVAVEGGADVANAALVGAVAASVVTTVVARIGK
jgi:hypothetical protein